MMNVSNGQEIDDQASTPEIRRRGPSRVSVQEQLPDSPGDFDVNALVPDIANNPVRLAKFRAAVQSVHTSVGPQAAQRCLAAMMVQRGAANAEPDDLISSLIDQIGSVSRQAGRILTSQGQQQFEAFTNATIGFMQQQQRAASSNVSQPSTSRQPSQQDRVAARKLLADRIPALVKGTSVQQYREKVTRILNSPDGASFSEQEKIEIVRKLAESDPDIYKSVDSSFGNKRLLSVNEYFNELEKLFAPDPLAYRDALRGTVQRDNEPACEFIDRVEKLGYKYWIGIPDSVETIAQIIDNMSVHHIGTMKLQLATSRNAMSRSMDPNPISFMDLRKWAAYSDSEFVQNKGKRPGKLQAGAAEADSNKGKGRQQKGKGKQRPQAANVNVEPEEDEEDSFEELLPSAFTVILENGSSSSSSDDEHNQHEEPPLLVPPHLSAPSSCAAQPIPVVNPNTSAVPMPPSCMPFQQTPVSIAQNFVPVQRPVIAPMPPPVRAPRGTFQEIHITNSRDALYVPPRPYKPAILQPPFARAVRRRNRPRGEPRVLGNASPASPNPEPTSRSKVQRSPPTSEPEDWQTVRRRGTKPKLTHTHDALQGSLAAPSHLKQSDQTQVSVKTNTAGASPAPSGSSSDDTTPAKSRTPSPGMGEINPPRHSPDSSMAQQRQSRLTEQQPGPFIYPEDYTLPEVNEVVMHRMRQDPEGRLPSHWLPPGFADVQTIHPTARIPSHLVTNAAGTPRPYGPFTNVLNDSFPNEENQVNLARFCSEHHVTVEPTWQIKHLNHEPIFDYPYPVAKMLTAISVKDNKPITQMIAPQVEIVGNTLYVTTLTHDSSEAVPELHTFAQELPPLLENRRIPVPDTNPLTQTIMHHEYHAMSAAHSRYKRATDEATRQHLEFRLYQQNFRDRERWTEENRQAERMAAQARPNMPSPPVSEPQTHVPQCNMFQSLGPLSGSHYDAQQTPLNVSAVQARRPRNPEAFRPQDKQGEIHKTPTPQHFFHTPEHRIGTATFPISLSSLVKLFRNPKTPAFIDATESLLNHNVEDSQGLLNMTQALSSVAKEMNLPLTCTLAGQQLAGGGSTNMDAGPISRNVDLSCPTSFVPSMSRAEIPIFSLITPSLQMEEPPYRRVDDTPYAAIAAVPTLSIPTASMPSFDFSFLNAKGNGPLADISRVAVLDTGCNVNLMSSAALERDWKLFGPAVKLRNVKPFNVRLADGQTQAHTVKVLQDVRLTIGKAWYQATFLVVDTLAHDYMLGWPFMLQYDVRLKPSRASMSLGLPVSNLLVKPELPIAQFQTVKIQFRTKQMTLPITGPG